MDSTFELCELERLAGSFFKFLGGVDLVILRKFTFTAPRYLHLTLEKCVIFGFFSMFIDLPS